MTADGPTPVETGARRGVILRWADQAGVAALLLLALVALAWYWVTRGGWRGELIEIEQVGPLTAQFQVDINQADWPELAQLPGIGETLARRIAATRAEQGPFRDHRQLLAVPGIGPSTLAQIKPYLLPLPAP
ncbi:MAG: hypothetical protein A2W31_06945 [Planctomycetes bacterium RBG_16_64_10]|nr:MAG: hypothetical protein A2W31_06945 [Planctomycetes bacterium RBG_16_64_10]